jgi:tripartite-type tricarboxylate transporter receptor subunit TctC
LLEDLAANRVKALAISGTMRHPLFPNLPTFAESGLPDFAPMAWFGIFAPGGTPQSITDALAAAIGGAARQPQFVEKMHRYGAQAASSSPLEFARFIELERAKWQSVAKAATSFANQ